MLLIGSRAAQYHWADFRQPNDWDFICAEEELHRLNEFQDPMWSPVINFTAKKFRYKIQGLAVEAEVAERLPSSKLILDYEKSKQNQLDYFHGVPFTVASPEVLFLLKRSHIPFKVHWKKNFFDHSFIQKKIGHLPLDLLSILDLRLAETKERVAYKEHSFKISNEKFFRNNINRITPHDNLHQLIKFYDRPMFEYIKRDLSQAEIDFQLFSCLPYEKQLANMAEEVMALSLERTILPAVVKKERYSERGAILKTTAELCYNYLPFEFRFFAVDNFFQIADFIPKNFSQSVIETLQPEIHRAQNDL